MECTRTSEMIGAAAPITQAIRAAEEWVPAFAGMTGFGGVNHD